LAAICVRNVNVDVIAAAESVGDPTSVVIGGGFVVEVRVLGEVVLVGREVRLLLLGADVVLFDVAD
jgi:hypothetical protein